MRYLIQILSGLLLLSTSLMAARDSVLVWSDEFQYEGAPDPAKWTYEYGKVRNDEAQYYTRDRRENARVENGVLIIEAHREPWEGAEYTSASVTTQGLAAWTYGRIDVRARFHTFRGTWPAIWLLSALNPYGYWPASGEIDIMENVGFAPDLVHGSIHTLQYNHMSNTHYTATHTHANLDFQWHTYSVLWSADSIHVETDGIRYFSFYKQSDDFRVWPFDHPFYLILNMAIGGSWGASQGIDDTRFPARMEVDYVRVYKMKYSDEPLLVQTPVEPAEAGWVQRTPEQTHYTALDTVELHARAHADWEFLRWSDFNRENPRSFLVDHAAHLTALFVPRGERIFQSNFPNGLQDWRFWNDGAVAATLEFRDGAACVRPHAAGEDWQVQLTFPHLVVAAGELYDLQVRTQAESARDMTASIRQNYEPYGALATPHLLQLPQGAQAHTHRLEIHTPSQEGRLELAFGASTTEVCVSEISLRLFEENPTTIAPQVSPWRTQMHYQQGQGVQIVVQETNGLVHRYSLHGKRLE